MTTRFYYFSSRKGPRGREVTAAFTSRRAAEAERARLGLGDDWQRVRIPRSAVRRPNPPKRKTKPRRNPAGLRLVYPHLRNIVAQKGEGEHLNCDAACKRADHVYEHVFTSEPPIYGTERDGMYFLKAKSLVIPA